MVSRPRKWQMATFNFEGEFATGPATSSLIVTQIAVIQGRFGESTTSQGRALNEAVRKLEIGGIVWTYGIDDWRMQAADFPLAGGPYRADFDASWCYDRCDGSGNPEALSTNWFNSKTPVSLATAQVAADDNDELMPLRVIRRFSGRRMYGYQGAGLDAPPITQQIGQLRWHGNLRLRAALDDDHTLVFHSALQTGSFWPDAGLGRIGYWLRGQLYYRFILGR